MHRNTYLNSPRLLDARLRLKAAPRLRFAGQITGCEGYVESAAVGLIAGRFAGAEQLGEALESPPPTTAIGALLNHITGGHIEAIDPGPRSFQPMNVNFGLFPLIAESRFDEAGRRLPGPERGLARKRALSARAERDLARWMERAPEPAPFAET
jgi:methylenetetrahydrofolate--tRNA-(uracil-5-)-methyltransferase